MKKNKLIFVLVSLFLLITVLSSKVFVIAEVEHECVGEDCYICQVIRFVENNLNSCISGLCIASSIAILIFAVVFLIDNRYFCLNKVTLITLKVKLTN